jgi:putative peptidoglycan lipid II flippase
MAASLKPIINAFVQAFHQPIISLAIINVLVALLAFIKDIILAAYAGTSLQADALTLAYFLPDSLGNNMFAAAISVVCVPVFSRLAVLEQFERLRKSIKQVSIRFLLIAFSVMLTAYGLSGKITNLLIGSSGSGLEQATLPLFRLLLPTIVIFVVIAIGTAVLQTLQRFITPAAASLLYNIILLAGVVYCIVSGIPVETGVSRIAISITLGVCFMGIWIFIFWHKAMAPMQTSADLRPAVSKVDLSEDWKAMVKIFIPYLVILFSIQAIFFAERYLITAYDTGAAAALNYAFRITQFPIWVFVAAISIVILPSLSQQMALGRDKAVNLIMSNAFRAIFIIIFPSMLFLFLLREPVTIALFQRGAFDARSVLLTTSILEGYSLSILSQSISLVCLRFFLAGRQLTIVLIIYASSALVTVCLDVWLISFMGPRGIGFGAAIGALLNGVLLLYMLWKSIRPSFDSVINELRLYRNVLIVPVIFFLISSAAWYWKNDHSTSFAFIFVFLSGCLFLLCYLYVLGRYWPGLFIAMKKNWGKG